MAATLDALESVFCADILGHIASFLPPNDVACNLRLVSRATAEGLQKHIVVRLSQPSPPAAFAAHWSAPAPCRTLSLKRRRQLVCLTAASGDVTNLKVALAATGLCPTVEVMVAAAAAGQLHVCRWLAAERGCLLDGPYTAESLLTAAAKGGSAEICEWLLEQGCAWSKGCVTSAALGGHPELMRALLRKAPPGPSGDVPMADLLSAATEGCDLGTVQELYRDGAGGDQSMLRAAAAAAARSPTPDWAAKVAWLLEQGSVQSRESIAAAAASCPDALARLTLLVEGMGFPADASAVDSAARAGRADALRWLLARALRPTDLRVYRQAAGQGHTEVLRVLHAADCKLPPPKDMLAFACTSGSVETASWALEACGAKTLQAAGPGAFDAAVRSGSLELVTWLRERGVGFGSDLWLSAAGGGCVAVLELLAEWGADVQAAFHSHNHPYLLAAGFGDLPTLEALRRLGLPLCGTRQERKALVGKAISVRAPLPALRWLRRAVGDVDWAAAAEAARSTTLRAGWRADVQAWVQAEAEAEKGSRSFRRVREAVGKAVRWASSARTGAAGRK